MKLKHSIIVALALGLLSPYSSHAIERPPVTPPVTPAPSVVDEMVAWLEKEVPVPPDNRKKMVNRGAIQTKIDTLATHDSSKAATWQQHFDTQKGIEDTVGGPKVSLEKQLKAYAKDQKTYTLIVRGNVEDKLSRCEFVWGWRCTGDKKGPIQKSVLIIVKWYTESGDLEWRPFNVYGNFKFKVENIPVSSDVGFAVREGGWAKWPVKTADRNKEKYVVIASYLRPGYYPKSTKDTMIRNIKMGQVFYPGTDGDWTPKDWKFFVEEGEKATSIVSRKGYIGKDYK